MQKYYRLSIFAACTLSLVLFLNNTTLAAKNIQDIYGTSDPGRSTSRITVPSAAIPESLDFATAILRDPWDMNEYTDVSQYLNESSQRDLVRDIRVESGKFSATSVGDGATGGNAYFFPLFPGYLETMKIGKIGNRYPVNSSQFHCLYTAMKVDSGPANASGPDVWRVFWFADPYLNTNPSSPWGLGLQALYPEAGAGQPTQIWKLHQMDLANPPITDASLAAWGDSSTWQGIRIDPTVQPGVTFAVDWVRLTDCVPNEQRISFTPDRTISSLWLRPADSTHFILAATDVNGASGIHSLDAQGIAPGKYIVGLGTSASCCISESDGNLTINQSPIVRFISPSETSGQDYARLSGNAWDFNDASDVTDIRFAESSNITDGLLNIVTRSGPEPAGADVQFDLNTPTRSDHQQFRYLTIRMYTEWDLPFQDLVGGMIARWIWTIDSLAQQPGYECHLVSQDIALDVGWQTYKIDLHNYFNGAAEDSAPSGKPHCPPLAYPPQSPPEDTTSNRTHWINTGSAIRFRFDPNENISCVLREKPGKSHIPCSDYRQKIDWIALTAMDQVIAGTPYLVEMDLNKSISLEKFSIYYTTDIANPKQNLAKAYRDPNNTPSSPTSPSGPYLIYLPTTINPQNTPANGTPNTFEQAAIPVNFLWDTSNVSSGEYFICADISDDINNNIFCSEATVTVTP